MTTTARKLNIAQEIARDLDGEWTDYVLDKVEPGETMFTCGSEGTCWGIGHEHGVEPRVGDTARLYGGWGRPIRGIDLNGEPVYYKTEREQEFDHAKFRMELEQKSAAEFEAKRDELDAAYEALPEPFRARLDRFRAADPTFRYESESYESFVLVEAAKIADALDLDTVAALRNGVGGETERWDGQREAAPFLSDGHSGNTWGAAWAFAEALLRGSEV